MIDPHNTLQSKCSNSRHIVALITLLISAALPLTQGAAQPGSSGLAFLKLGTSARAIAMSDAMTADAFGAASAHYNPALLLPAADSSMPAELLVMHREWIQDTRTEFLGASAPLNENNALGLTVSTTTVSSIEIRTRPGDAEGTFTARDFAVGLSWARRIGGIRAGLTGKFLYEKIFTDETSGFAADAGLAMDTPVDGLTAGAAVTNIGSMNAFRLERPTLPATGRAGASYLLPFSSSTVTRALLDADYLYVFPEKGSYFQAGGEVILLDAFAVRLGYRTGGGQSSFSAGAGARYGIVSFDYAFSRVAAELGNGHTVSLRVTL